MKKNKDLDLLNANLDEDSSEDDDYVPDAKANKECEKELLKQNGPSKDDPEKELTGIDLIKLKKRQKETDDLWDLMNIEEDPIYKKKLEGQKQRKV